MATIKEQAAAIKGYAAEIDAAIVAKGGTTDGGLRHAANAIEALPSGGDDPLQWSKYFRAPAAWPNLPKMLEEDTEPYAGKMFMCYPSTGDGLDVYIPTGGTKVVFGDGAEYTSGFGGTHTFATSESKRMWCKVYCEADKSIIVGQTGANNKALAIVANRYALIGLIPQWVNGSGLRFVKATGTLNLYSGSSVVAWVLPEGITSVLPYSNQTFHAANNLVEMPDLRGSVGAGRFDANNGLRRISDTIDFRGSTSAYVTSFLQNKFWLERLPTHFTANVSINAGSSHFVAKDSVATFESIDGELICTGGFVGNLKGWDSATSAYVDRCPTDGTTVTLSHAVYNMFTAEERDAIEACMERKNRTLAW